MANLIPLHIHTEYSLLDGMIRVSDLVNYAKDNGLNAIAITDHGVMYSAIEFYEQAKAAGINPLIGCEFYVHDGDIHQKDNLHNPLYHLILIAKDQTGYKNLIKLVSTAWCEGFYYKPRINFELLKEYHEGLICTSACLGGEVLQHLQHGEKEKAIETAKKYKELFGDDYYIELQDHGLEEQKRTNPELIKIAKELGIKMVITNDSHYLRKEDADAQDSLLCLQTNADKSDPNRFHFPNNEFYVKSQEEMRKAFSWMDDETFNECVQNTQEAADKCHIEIELGNAPLPHYEVPEGYTNETYLEHIVYEGLKKRYGEITPELKERVDYELRTINKMGFAAYFLITWDFIHYAKTHDIPVGPGRGSAAGSVVAYALEITDLDPIKHHLLFERFLNEERYTMPDIDIDFCIEKRRQVIDYVTQKYGEDKVCQIITFSTYAPKAAFKGIARILKVPFVESNRLTGLIEPAIELAAATNPKAKWIKDALQVEGSELRKLYDEDYQIPIPETGESVSYRKIIDMSCAIEGLKCGTGTHAAGVIISHAPLDTIIPVQPSKDGIVQTGYPPHEVTEVLSLLKMDFLGLRNLTMIYKTVDMVKHYEGIDIDINNIPLDDPETYKMLVRGETVGVFQLESQGMINLVKRLKPDVFEDLGALVALFRPGPLGSGMVDEFVDRKHGIKAISYPHPLLEPILKDTYGTIVYQEQIMQVFQTLADYSLGQADIVRRMMGKKKIEEMQKQKAKFIELASSHHGMKKEDATTLFEQIEKFASYCFNRSHSAAYAFVAYQTAYLKCHYPVEYLSALLSSVSDNKDQTQLYIEEALRYGIKVLPPDINKSYLEYAPDGKNIRFGLAAIKQVGEPVCEAIIKEREENGEFKSIFDFCKRLDTKFVNKKSLEGLIKAGAFANIEKSRKQLFENIEHILDVTSKEAKDRAMGQVSLFSTVENSDEFTGVQYQLLGSDEEYADKELQQFEKEFLGFYVTSHPLFSIRDKLQFLITHRISELNEAPEDEIVTICGLITATRQIPTKKDPSKFLRFVTIEDLSGKVDAVCFHKKLLEYGDILQPENKVVITGRLQHRGEDQLSIVVENVKSVDNSNIVTVNLLKDVKYEELCGIKNILAKHHGDDPVMIKLPAIDGYSTKIMTSSMFWVNSTNDLINQMKQVFPDKVDIKIDSLDTPFELAQL